QGTTSAPGLCRGSVHRGLGCLLDCPPSPTPGRAEKSSVCLSVCAGNALHISVSPSPVRARPGSDVLLGCQLSVEGGSVDLKHLVVQWKLGEQLVAEYDDTLWYGREGARLSKEGLQHGNASLLLPRVGAADTGVYMCFIIYTLNHQSGEVELRLEGNLQRTGGTTHPSLPMPLFEPHLPQGTPAPPSLPSHYLSPTLCIAPQPCHLPAIAPSKAQFPSHTVSHSSAASLTELPGRPFLLPAPHRCLCP
uniref:Ig-like domain-containing protein n=1 Tax=Pelusios castaneus TaxID=367368 RepID=A0A8C8SD24_9SAUR